MKKTYTYNDCYQILRLEPGCSHNELRKSYKKLIQKWHPDRFNDESKEKSAADEKIKVINIAYSQLQAYYRNNNVLPDVEEITKSSQSTKSEKGTQTNSNESATNSTEKSSGNESNTRHSNDKFNHQERSTSAHDSIEKKFRQPVFSAIIFFILTATFYYIFTDTLNDLTNDKDQQFAPNRVQASSASNSLSTTKDHLNTKTTDNLIPLSHKENNTGLENVKTVVTSDDESVSEHETYFTQGSKMGDVIGIQGPPDKTEGDIWYYGESEVHFSDGEVSHWVRRIGHPIKANIDFESTVTRKLHSTK